MFDSYVSDICWCVYSAVNVGPQDVDRVVQLLERYSGPEQEKHVLKDIRWLERKCWQLDMWYVKRTGSKHLRRCLKLVIYLIPLCTSFRLIFWIVHSGDWCPRLVLCTPIGARQKWMNEWVSEWIYESRCRLSWECSESCKPCTSSDSCWCQPRWLPRTWNNRPSSLKPHVQQRYWRQKNKKNQGSPTIADKPARCFREASRGLFKNSVFNSAR